MQSIVKAVVSPGSSGTIVSSWNMLKVERVPMALPSAVWIQMDTQIAQLPQTTNMEKYKSTLLFYLLTVDPAIFINTRPPSFSFYNHIFIPVRSSRFSSFFFFFKVFNFSSLMVLKIFVLNLWLLLLITRSGNFP